MPLSAGLSRWLTSQGHDAIHASEVELFRAADTEIIAHAGSDDRIVVTADLDYPHLLALSGADRPAVILFRGGDWSTAQAIGRLQVVLAVISADELVSSLVVVERTRIRRRTLPLRAS
jgi:predicted nuclease of predicted toxin-antitoxin system